MGSVVQRVKVNVHCGCTRGRKSQRRKQQYCKSICGKIFQLCDSKPNLYFRAFKRYPSAIVRIGNQSDCRMMVVITLSNGRQIVEDISQGQQVSVAVPSIKKVEISCTGEKDTFCRGDYLIKILN